jgi:hypothetical protein
MVIIMDTASGNREGVAAAGVDALAEDGVLQAPACYSEDVLLAGFTELPAEWRGGDRPVAPRLAAVTDEAEVADPAGYMHRIYAAQGLPGRKR